MDLLELAKALEILISLPITIIIVAIILLLLNHRSLDLWLTVPMRIKNIKAEYLQTLLKKNKLMSPATRNCVQDVLDARIFQYTTGIYAEHKLRELLESLNNQTSFNISRSKISLAWRYLEERDGQIQIKQMNKRGKLMWLLNWILAIVFIALFAFCFLAAFYLIEASPFEEALAYAVVLGMEAVAFAVMSQPFVSAIHAWRAAYQINSEMLMLNKQHLENSERNEPS